MLTETEARGLASHWIAAWNAHDLDAILSHYGDDVVLQSPVAAKRGTSVGEFMEVDSAGKVVRVVANYGA
ncbi:MAG TPA: nuclear transport factor 2 family protein [Gemmatimonadales bacterium]|nr:nuclear transport factor 2 family protein [Gemmatimonadales bacterium]